MSAGIEGSLESDSFGASWNEDRVTSYETELDRETDHRDGVSILSTQKTANLEWNQIMKFKDIKPFYNHFQWPSNNHFIGSVEKTALLFIDRTFSEVVAGKTNKFSVSPKENLVYLISSADEIEACIGVCEL